MGTLISSSNKHLAALIKRQTRFAVLVIIDLKDAARRSVVQRVRTPLQLASGRRHQICE